MILTSRTRYESYLQCPRLGFLAYDASNGTSVGGWMRRALALPLATGSHVHTALAALLTGAELESVVTDVLAGYRAEVAERGLDIEAGEIADVADEQAALVEALVRAWARVRLPRWLDEFEVVDVEREESAVLAADEGGKPGVTLMARADAIVRRKADRRLFVASWKTVNEAGERWYHNFEVDAQLLTETLAVEQRLGEPIAGVLVEGLVKGRRTPEKDSEGNILAYRQGSPLIYGYKFPGNLPLEPASYDWNYTRKKGWVRFPVWREEFAAMVPAVDCTPIQYWVSWLPPETVEQQFAVVPPILADSALTQAHARQMVAEERRTAELVQLVKASPSHLDDAFPQNRRRCYFPTKCFAFEICHVGGVLADPAGSGLYLPRVAHHPQEEAK